MIGVVVRVLSTVLATTTTTTTSMMSLLPMEDRLEQVVQDLERQGIAVLELQPMMRQQQSTQAQVAAMIHPTAFATAKRAFHMLAGDSGGAPSSSAVVVDSCQRIRPDQDSAHATGYHTAGDMSRYNTYREGFVISDGASFGLGLASYIPEFEQDLQDLSESMHWIAQQVLSTMERKWDLPEDWFQTTLGDTKQHSQWHMKRYVKPEKDLEPDTSMVEEDGVLLPSHTDPSLISIIVHDAPNMQDGCMGLQYQGPPNGGKREWIEVPKHGHLVATIMVGSVLGYITGGIIPPAKHRVIATDRTGERLAATLFVRPRSNAMLQVPPSIVFQNVSLKKKLTFDTWNARVSRNYMKGKVLSPAVQERHDAGKEKETACEQKSLDYFSDDYTEFSLLHSHPTLTGANQFNGGVLCTGNGKIYTIPGHAPQMLMIDPHVEPPNTQPIGPIMGGAHKWRNGVSSISTGMIYALPCHADHVLRIHPETNEVSSVAWDDTDELAPAVGMPWKWHGACISNLDSCLYGIPDCAEHVLKMDPRAERVTFLASERLEGEHKFCGGLLGTDGAIYGIPRNARGVLRIDPVTQSTCIHGTFPEGGNKWNGGIMTPNGTIYGIPEHANSILKIVPGNPPKISTMEGPWRIRDDLEPGDSLYLGGIMGNDGNIYFIPSNADYVLQLSPKTDVVRQIGPNLKSLEQVHKNKWQNGFCGPDGAIYGIPLNATSILRIRPGDGKHPDVTTIGGPYLGHNKWAGGVLSKDGAMYCIPQNHSMVLRIKPVERKSNGDKLSQQLPVLRSSAHTLKYSKARAKGKGTEPKVNAGFPLPDNFRAKTIFSYDSKKFGLREEVIRMLSEADPLVIGGWEECHSGERRRLDDFRVAQGSLVPERKGNPVAQGGSSQRTLSDIVASDRSFLALFDHFLEDCIVPWMKARLIDFGLASHELETTFYYQRPPTLRIQPGPSVKYVRPHCDKDYGHQDGELNFWMPLTDVGLNMTDLFVESKEGLEDYQPLGVEFEEVAAFHGSSCRHYAPANKTEYTRVSLDFRVGVEGFFDPNWVMLGTKSDHNRREIKR